MSTQRCQRWVCLLEANRIIRKLEGFPRGILPDRWYVTVDTTTASRLPIGSCSAKLIKELSGDYMSHSNNNSRTRYYHCLSRAIWSPGIGPTS